MGRHLVVAVREVVRLGVDDELVAAERLVRSCEIVNGYTRNGKELRPELVVQRDECGGGSLSARPESLGAALSGLLGEVRQSLRCAPGLLRQPTRRVLVSVEGLEKRRTIITGSHQPTSAARRPARCKTVGGIDSPG